MGRWGGKKMTKLNNCMFNTVMARCVEEHGWEKRVGLSNGQRGEYGVHQRRLIDDSWSLYPTPLPQRSGWDVRGWCFRHRWFTFLGGCPHLRLRRGLILRSLFVLQSHHQHPRRRRSVGSEVDPCCFFLLLFLRPLAAKVRRLFSYFDFYVLLLNVDCWYIQLFFFVCSDDLGKGFIEQKISNKKLNKLMVNFEAWLVELIKAESPWLLFCGRVFCAKCYRNLYL